MGYVYCTIVTYFTGWGLCFGKGRGLKSMHAMCCSEKNEGFTVGKKEGDVCQVKSEHGK
jgi:hypothetical protein